MTLRDLERRIRRLERARKPPAFAGLHVVYLPDDLPEGCEDPEAWLAERREEVLPAMLFVVRFVGVPPCP